MTTSCPRQKKKSFKLQWFVGSQEICNHPWRRNDIERAAAATVALLTRAHTNNSVPKYRFTIHQKSQHCCSRYGFWTVSDSKDLSACQGAISRHPMFEILSDFGFSRNILKHRKWIRRYLAKLSLIVREKSFLQGSCCYFGRDPCKSYTTLSDSKLCSIASLNTGLRVAGKYGWNMSLYCNWIWTFRCTGMNGARQAHVV